MSKNVDAIKLLHKLKRQMGRERARLVRWYNDETSTRELKDRCWYEINIWDASMNVLDREVRKLKAS